MPDPRPGRRCDAGVDRFPRWAGAWAAAAGLAYLGKGLGVAYQGFVGGVTGLIARQLA
jgi:hypothetical protein